MSAPIKCPACDGRGSHPGSAPRKRVKCRGCEGKGLLHLAPTLADLFPLPTAPMPQRALPDVVPWIQPYVPIPTIPLQPFQPMTWPWGDITVTCVVSS